MVPPRLSHVDARGTVRMVDVGGKPVTTREALARGEITMSAPALRQIRGRKVAKGDPLQAARLAGINLTRMKIGMYMLCGATAGLAGVLLTARTTSGNPINGVGFELQLVK